LCTIPSQGKQPHESTMRTQSLHKQLPSSNYTQVMIKLISISVPVVYLCKIVPWQNLNVIPF